MMQIYTVQPFVNKHKAETLFFKSFPPHVFKRMVLRYEKKNNKI
jgi:hypothetical protein